MSPGCLPASLPDPLVSNDDDAVPVPVSEDAQTAEVPIAPVPRWVGADEVTVPVQSSLEKILRHEMLRHQSERQDDEG